LLAAVCFFFSCAYLNTLASVCAGYRTPWILVRNLDGTASDKRTLPDLGHDVWAFILQYFGFEHDYVNDYSIPDQLVTRLSVFTILFGACHPQRFVIMRRSVVILGIMMALRAITVSVTQLPDASPVCQAQFDDPDGRGHYKRTEMFPKAFWRAWIFLWDPTHHVSCGDMVFSGHTTCLTICAMVFKRYCKAKWLKTKVFIRWHPPEWSCTLVRWAVYVYVFVGALLIIGTRLHYTLDVCIAAFATHGLFSQYHSWLRYKRLKGKASILQWFEAEEIISVEQEAYERASKKE